MNNSTLLDRSSANRSAAGETIAIAMRAAQAHDLSNRSILLSLWTTAVSTLIEDCGDLGRAAEALTEKASSIKGQGRNADAPSLRIDTVTTQRRVAEATEAAKLIGTYLGDFLAHLREQDREDEFPDAVVDSTFGLLANIWGPFHLRRAIAAQVQALADGLENPIFPQEPSVSNLEPNQVPLRPPERESWRGPARQVDPVPVEARVSPPRAPATPPPVPVGAPPPPSADDDAPPLEDVDDVAPPPMPDEEDAPQFSDDSFDTPAFSDDEPSPSDEVEYAPSAEPVAAVPPGAPHAPPSPREPDGLPPLADDAAMSALEALLEDEPEAAAPVQVPVARVASAGGESSDDEDSLLSILDVPVPPPVAALDDMPPEMPEPPVTGRGRGYLSAAQVEAHDHDFLTAPRDEGTDAAPTFIDDEVQPPEQEEEHVAAAPPLAAETEDARIGEPAPDADVPEPHVPMASAPAVVVIPARDHGLVTAPPASVAVVAEAAPPVIDRAPEGSSVEEGSGSPSAERRPEPLPPAPPERRLEPVRVPEAVARSVLMPTEAVTMPAPNTATVASRADAALYAAHAAGDADRWIDCCIGVETDDEGRDSVFAAVATILSADGTRRERREMSGRLVGLTSRKATLRACKEVLLRLGSPAEGETLQVSTSADALLRGMIEPSSRLRTPAETALWNDIDVLCAHRTVEWVQRRPGMGTGAAEHVDRMIRAFMAA